MAKKERLFPVTIYTDGACSGNPGPGGWAALLTLESDPTNRREIVGGEKMTTNNKMELQACISALSVITKPCKVNLYTDSTYVMKGITEWIHAWKKNGWKTAAKKDVSNSEMWKKLYSIVYESEHKVTFHWVKAHHTNANNNYVDSLAVAESLKYK